MKITILDGNALNPGDLSWKPLEEFGSVTVYPRTEQKDVVSRIGDSDAVISQVPSSGIRLRAPNTKPLKVSNSSPGI